MKDGYVMNFEIFNYVGMILEKKLVEVYFINICLYLEGVLCNNNIGEVILNVFIMIMDLKIGKEI